MNNIIAVTLACMLGGAAFAFGGLAVEKSDRLMSSPTGGYVEMIKERPAKDQSRLIPEGWKPGAI